MGVSSNPTSHNYAIIVAGGSGTRMQAAVPKQFLPLCDRPIMMHTIEAFYFSAVSPFIILVLPVKYHDYWRQLCTEHNFTLPHQLVAGGETRFHSVKNAVDSIDPYNDALVAIHDAVRPLTSRRVIEASYKYADEHCNAVAAVKSRDSVRLMENEVSKSLPRNDVYLVQTPQTFQLEQLKKAYLQPYDIKFTDDASVVEETGIKINLIAGDYNNIKITFPEDLAFAEMILKKSS